MSSPRYQQGRSLLGMIALAIVVGFFLLLGVRLIPVYMDYWTIVSVAESVHEDPELRDASPREVRQALRSRMLLNNLRDYEPEEIYSVGRGDGGGLIIVIDYEEREPFLLNVDLVTTFERRIEP